MNMEAMEARREAGDGSLDQRGPQGRVPLRQSEVAFHLAREDHLRPSVWPEDACQCRREVLLDIL